jgi:hypothetical protein
MVMVPSDSKEAKGLPAGFKLFKFEYSRQYEVRLSRP